MRQGAENGALHIIVSGQVEIYAAGEPRVELATLGPGEFFGEMACLSGEPASATVASTAPVVTIALDREGRIDTWAAAPWWTAAGTASATPLPSFFAASRKRAGRCP